MFKIKHNDGQGEEAITVYAVRGSELNAFFLVYTKICGWCWMSCKNYHPEDLPACLGTEQ